MEKGRTKRIEPHYYSARLRNKLNGLRSVSTTIVEAPSGFGKTTAIRDYLEATLPSGIPVYWFTATDEAPSACFRRFSREIEKIDGSAGQRLLRIEFPGADTIGEVCEALRSLQCKNEAYLVVDNFQFLHTALPTSFFISLIEHGSGRLHTILITQMLKRNVLAAISGYGFLHITAADLRLDSEDIRRYYLLAGLNVAPKEAKSVADYTEGWIIAVYLQLRSFREKGAFSDTRDILDLMEHLVWRKLTPEQQKIFLRLSPFETATVRQICTLLGCEALPDYVVEALSSPFIRYDPTETRYELHSILHELIKQKRNERGVAFECECLLRAGDLCRADGQAAEALGFYWQVGDYGRLLSLDFSDLSFEKIGDTPFFAIALDIARNCPAEIKEKFPLPLLHVAWTLLLTGYHAQFETLLEEMSDILNGENGDDSLLGELTLLSSFRRHPRIEEMTALLRKADAFFQGKCSRVILPSAPWCFGNSSPLAHYHITPGEADRKAEELEEYIALYAKLTNGHGCGADVLYRAQLAYQRGNLDEAEILAYKAAFLAENRQQSIVHLGAMLVLAQVALNKADTAGWQQAVSSMERALSYVSQDSFVFRSQLDIVQGMLLVELKQLDGVADWIKNGDFTSQRLLPALVPLALFVHAVYLLHQGEYARLIGVTGAMYPHGVFSSPLMTMLLYLAIAAGYIQLGNRDKASAFIRNAAQSALPDGLIFPFASFSWLLLGLSDELIRQEYPAFFEGFQKIKERFGLGWAKLYQDLQPRDFLGDLTEREYEVAKLAADGLHNAEIAKELMITESTVRFHLRAVFAKLDIDRRTRLAEKLKQA